MKYLGMKEAIKELPQSAEYDVVLGCLDVKDAFLQVPQKVKVFVKPPRGYEHLLEEDEVWVLELKNGVRS